MNSHLTRSLIAGIVSAVLFMAVLASGLGFFFLFLPTLPLLIQGMEKGSRIALWACAIATFLIALAAGPLVSAIYLILLGLPAWYMARQAVLSRQFSLAPYLAAGKNSMTLTQWFPVGVIMMQLTLYACAIIALFGLAYIGTPGGMEAIVAQSLRENFKEVTGEYKEMLDQITDSFSFLIFSMTLWLWALSLYTHLWLANLFLIKRNQAKRPDMMVRPFSLPNWMFSLIAICALASMIGGPTTAFLGKISLISLMLPYFFLGIAIMHTASLVWPSRKVFLFFIYFFMIAQLWPVFILSAIGIYFHIKHLSFSATSTRS